MNQSDFRALLHRYQHGDCTPAENRRIEQWYAHLGTERQLGLTADEESELVATVWERIAWQTGAAAPIAARPLVVKSCRPAAGPHQAWPSSLRWAAVALLASSAGLMATLLSGNAAKWPVPGLAPAHVAGANKWQVYANPSAYEVRVALPDGSAVALAQASTLKYRRTADGTRRLAYLNGAASFDVFHDKNHPFSVYTDKVVTTVLGTSFRVRAYAGQPEVQVQVLTGAVRVSPREPQVPGVVLLPNQQAVYSPARRQLRRELVAQPAQLAPQSFVFRDRPVAEVLTALEKAYGVAIVYDAAVLRNCTINLSLRDEPLFAKLDMLCETLGATYEKADGRILFHSQPCQVE